MSEKAGKESQYSLAPLRPPKTGVGGVTNSTSPIILSYPFYIKWSLA